MRMGNVRKQDSLKKKPPQGEYVSRTAHRVRLPGFLLEADIGLGDLVKKTAYAMGIEPCGGCERRATALNRWLTFTR
jgi:hypothetical protein